MHPLAGIYNFREISPDLATAGQPRQEQFEAIQKAGYDAVINLALPSSDHALPHEGSLVTSLGMSYFHIPVSFGNPGARDFDTFRAMMAAFTGRKVFVHCAANMRVSAFVYLHRVLELNVPQVEAVKDLHAIWEPDAVWKRFIEDRLLNLRKTLPGN